MTTPMVAFQGRGFDGSLYDYQDYPESEFVPGPVATLKRSVSERLGR